MRRSSPPSPALAQNSQATHSFPKSVRLLRSPEFRRVFDKRRSGSDNVLIVYAARNDLGHCRLGMAVSRKVGNAVVRNRWKRRIREAFRLQQASFAAGWDFVVLPKRAAKPEADAIFDSLASLVKRMTGRKK